MRWPREIDLSGGEGKSISPGAEETAAVTPANGGSAPGQGPFRRLALEGAGGLLLTKGN
jgi:hypothetical protein